MVNGEFSKLNSTDTGDHILYRPLVSQDVEKFETRRTGMDTISDGIRDLLSIQVDEKFRINKVGMIR